MHFLICRSSMHPIKVGRSKGKTVTIFCNCYLFPFPPNSLHSLWVGKTVNIYAGMWIRIRWMRASSYGGCSKCLLMFPSVLRSRCFLQAGNLSRMAQYTWSSPYEPAFLGETLVCGTAPPPCSCRAS